MEWILQVPILFFSVVLHEFSHGYAAYRNGDDTAYLSGRLTLAPLPHIDLFGTVLLPILCYLGNMPMFGWAKPVPVNPYRLNNPRRDIVKVAFAGPLSNIVLALLAVIGFRLVFMLPPSLGGDFLLIVLKALKFALIVNITLAVFNLIPIAPLDGSQILNGLLPPKASVVYQKHAPYGIWILLGLMITGFIKFLLVPPIYFTFVILSKLGIPIF